MMIRTVLAILLLALAACGGDAPELAAAPGEAAFDREESETLLAEGRQVALADPGAAVPLFRAAGLRWPDNLEAWERLADAERSRGNLAEAEAALKTYLEEQRALPVRNESTQTYGARLAEFYDALLAERPAYEAPSGIFNLAPHEIPTALITGGAGYVYFSTLGGS